MTTIAYHHKDKEIAVDSRASNDRIITTDSEDKMISRPEGRYVLCGILGDLDDFVDAHIAGTSVEDLSVWGFVLRDNECFRLSTDEGKIKEQKMTYSYAEGSGRDFAWAAMDFGRTAKQAVQYATTRDPFSGGKIKVYQV